MATYWIEVMRALAQPTSYRLQVTPGTVQGPWWVGPEWPVTPRGDDAETFEWMGREGAEALATFCRVASTPSMSVTRSFPGRPDLLEKVRVLTVPPLMWKYPGGQGARARAGLPRHDLLDARVQRQAAGAPRYPPASI